MDGEKSIICLTCQGPLSKKVTDSGLYFECANCGGRLMNFSVARKMKPESGLARIFQSARSSKPGNRICPSCHKPMQLLAVHAFSLDICLTCMMIWFDKREFENLPIEASSNPLTSRNLDPASLAIIELSKTELRKNKSRKDSGNLILAALVLAHPFLLFWLGPSFANSGRRPNPLAETSPWVNALIVSTVICVPAVITIKFGAPFRNLVGSRLTRLIWQTPEPAEIPESFTKFMGWALLLLIPTICLWKFLH